jgi:hypothetical protein
VIEVERARGVLQRLGRPAEVHARELPRADPAVEVAGHDDRPAPAFGIREDRPRLVPPDVVPGAGRALEVDPVDAHRPERRAQRGDRRRPAQLPEAVLVRQQELARLLERPGREQRDAEIPVRHGVDGRGHVDVPEAEGVREALRPRAVHFLEHDEVRVTQRPRAREQLGGAVDVASPLEVEGHDTKRPPGAPGRG